MKKGWEYKTLGECCDIYNGNSINSDYKMKNFAGRKEGYPFIATKDISFNGIINYDNGIKIPYDSTFKIAYPESVFICAEGGSAGRKIAFVNEKVCFGNKLFCISPHTNSEFIGKYIYYYLNSDYFQKQFQSLLTGLIGGVSAKKFKEITIIKNSIDEQRRIVSYLDSSFDYIDKIKENASKSLSEAKALFQSALAEAMEPKEGAKMNKVGDVFETYAGGTPLKSHKDYYEDGNIPWLRSGEVCCKYIYETEMYITQKGLENSSAKYYPKNTVVVAMYGATAAQVGILKIKTTSNQAVCGILPNKDFIPEYVYYWFLYIQDELAAQAQGGAQPNISQIKIKNVLIPIIDIKTQQQIVSRLDSLSSKVRAIEEKYQKMVEECDALKQAMLRDVFE